MPAPTPPAAKPVAAPIEAPAAPWTGPAPVAGEGHYHSGASHV